jgi:hypothetical protein
MRAWLAAPSTYPRNQHEAAIRLFASDLGDGDAVPACALCEELARLDSAKAEIEAQNGRRH